MRLRTWSALLLLMACGHVDPRGLWEVRRQDPLTVDPAVLALHLDLPQGYGIRSGTARLVLGEARGAISEVFVLRAEGGAFAVAMSDHARFRDTQARLRAARAEEGDFEGELGLFAGPCRTGAARDEDPRIGASLRTGPSAAAIPLLSAAPLSALAPGLTLEALPDCRSAP